VPYLRIGVYEHKARKGLIRVSIRVAGGVIDDVSVTGDFFIYPEDSVFQLESSLKGLEASWEAVSRVLDEFFSKGLELAGATPEDFKIAFRKALEEAGLVEGA
jgi:hypothetical protein